MFLFLFGFCLFVQLLLFFYCLVCFCFVFPSGEAAFSVLSDYEYIWPADAMKPHLSKLTPSVPITFIYGEKSAFNNQGGEDIGKDRDNVFVPNPLPDIGHHVQIQNAHLFNERLKDIMSRVDWNTDKCKKIK